MENELMTMEQEITFDEAEDYGTECSGGGKGKLLVGAAVVAGVTAIGGIVYHKCKGKLEERRINKLRKKGYVIFKEDECEVRQAEEEDFDDDFLEEETDEKTE